MSENLLFVNSRAEGENVARDKTVRDARSFVMRKIRSEKTWSSKSTKPTNRRKTRHPKSQESSKSSQHVVPVLTNDPHTCMHVYPSRESASSSRSQGGRRSGKTAVDAGTRRCKLCGQIVDSLSGSPASGVSAISDRTNLAVPSPRLPALDVPLDPFSSLAVRLNQKAKGLLGYFLRGIAPHLTPMATLSQQNEAILKYWLQPALQHRAFMHSLLCLSALQLCVMQPSRSTDDVVHHKVLAINAVQENLFNYETSITDENIAAVFNLLCVEENMFLPIWRSQTRRATRLEPDHRQQMVQMEGLKQMIQMRGGVRNLNTMRGLQILLMRHTAVQAVTSFDVAYTLPEDTLFSIYGYPQSSPFWTSPQPIAAACEVFDINETLLELIKTAGCLTQDTLAWYKDNSEYGWDILDVQSIFAALIDRFLLWYLQNLVTSRRLEGVFALCMIGFLAFICRGRGNVRGPLRQNMVSNLKCNISCSEVHASLKRTKLLVWLSTIAAIGSTGTQESDFFMKIFSAALTEYRPKITTLESLMTTLRSLLWMPRPLDEYVGELWRTYELWKQRLASDVPSLTSPSEAMVGVSQSGVQAFLNPYANGHPMTHVIVRGSAYGL